MQPAVAEELIRGGADRTGGVWADLGAGTGTFTLALARLLGPGAIVHAVDRDESALRELSSKRVAGDRASVVTVVADFREPLGLAGLDGLLMANSLHFVPRDEQVALVARLAGYLGAGGALVLVEYEQERASPWVPYPVPPTRFSELAEAVGLSQPREIGRMRSRFGAHDIYAAVAHKALVGPSRP